MEGNAVYDGNIRYRVFHIHTECYDVTYTRGFNSTIYNIEAGSAQRSAASGASLLLFRSCRYSVLVSYRAVSGQASEESRIFRRVERTNEHNR